MFNPEYFPFSPIISIGKPRNEREYGGVIELIYALQSAIEYIKPRKLSVIPGKPAIDKNSQIQRVMLKISKKLR